MDRAVGFYPIDTGSIPVGGTNNESSNMRAKVNTSDVKQYKDNQGKIYQENLYFTAVCKPDGYDKDGLDEDNTYSKFTPAAEFRLTVTNPALFDKFKVGEKYYVDFTKVE